MRPLSQIEIRNVDRVAIDQFGLPGVVLMENAGRGCAEAIGRHWVPGSVVVCCGKGNNGGDGFVIARYLENAGWRVKVRLAEAPDAIQGDAAVFLAVVQRSGIDLGWVQSSEEFMAELQAADLVVDALLGTGLTGAARSPYAEIMVAMNASGRPVLAIDLPSGLDCNTGKPLGVCIRAARTATLVSRKLGFENPHSETFTGPVEVIDLGLPQALVRQFEERAPESLPSPPISK